MGELEVVNFISLDGVIQSAAADEDRSGGFAHGGWVVPYSDEDVAEFMRSVTVHAAGMLLGRCSYQILENAWSGGDRSEPAVAAMNEMPKYVVTTSRDDLSWVNSHRIEPTLPDGIIDLKGSIAGDLVVFGSGELVRSLARYDLVDEYRLLLFPIVLGAGKRMFDDDSALASIKLADSRCSPSGVVMLTYTHDQAVGAS